MSQATGADPGTWGQIENTVADLRQADSNTFERHIKKLSRLLHSPDLDGTTRKLVEGIDLDAWQQSGHGKLEWPSEIEKEVGTVVLLIDRFSENVNSALIFARTFYYNGTNNISSTLRNMADQMIVPFARDYIDHVHRNTRTAAEGTITEGTTADEPIPAAALIEIREALEEIKTRLPAISVSNAVKSEIHADISHIEIEAERPTPRPLLMKLYLESLRDNLAKAAGAGDCRGIGHRCWWNTCEVLWVVLTHEQTSRTSPTTPSGIHYRQRFAALRRPVLYLVSLPLCAFPAKVASAALCKIFCTRQKVIVLAFEHSASATRF